ncbi:hypothetical protein FRB90_001939 [Tulasnella sp. 427]|nr:hypothetical protein FRB90_001939 [Tulasnella sp. 427]
MPAVSRLCVLLVLSRLTTSGLRGMAIQAYKAGCQAYSASLSGSTTLSLATTSTGSSVMPLPTLHTYQDSPGLSTGAISGIASGAVSFASLCIFAGYLWYKESQNRRRIDPVTPMVVRRQAPADQEFVGPIRVMTHASGTRIDLEGGPDEIPEVPQRLPRSRRPSQA